MSHGPITLSHNKSGAATEFAHEPTETLSPFLAILRDEGDQLLRRGIVIAQARLPVYVQTDDYRYYMEQDATLAAEQNGQYLRICKKREQVLGRFPLKLLIAQHVIDSMPEKTQMVQRSLLAAFNDDFLLGEESMFKTEVRCVDAAGGIGEAQCDYTLLDGIRKSLYVHGRDLHGQKFDEYHNDTQPQWLEAFARFEKLYEHLGERALSMEDTNTYLMDVASRPRSVYLV